MYLLGSRDSCDSGGVRSQVRAVLARGGGKASVDKAAIQVVMGTAVCSPHQLAGDGRSTAQQQEAAQKSAVGSHGCRGLVFQTVIAMMNLEIAERRLLLCCFAA